MPVKRNHHEVQDAFDPVAYEARGCRRWKIDISFTHNGLPVRIQKRAFLTRSEAMAFVEQELYLIRSGQKDPHAPKPSRQAAGPGITTEEALELILAYWMDSGRKKASTLSIQRIVLFKHVVPYIGTIPWQNVTQSDIDALVKAARGMKSPAHLAVLRSCIRDSRKAGIEPPSVELDPPRITSTARTDWINAADLERICSASSPLHGAVWRFLWNTGLRIGEFCALEYGDLDLGLGRESMTVSRTVYALPAGFSVTSPKNGKSRTIPLNHAAVHALQDIASITRPGKGMEAPGLVFPSTQGGYCRTSSLSGALIRACKASGFRRITCHVLRHSFGSNLVQGGVDLHTVSVLMGHSSVAMTQRYAHLSPDGLRSASRKLDTLSRKARK